MHHGTEVLPMEFIQKFFRIRKNSRIPRERAILGVPSGRAKARPEIDQRIARQFFLPEGLRFGDNFFPTGECAMRLLITKTP